MKETIALWHEAGEWWKGEPERVVHRFLDAGGNLKEEVAPLPPRIPIVRTGDAPRIRRVRDEKVSRACGFVNEPKYGSKVVTPSRLGEGGCSVVNTNDSREKNYETNSLLLPSPIPQSKAALDSALPPFRPSAFPEPALLHVQSGYAYGRSTMITAEIPAFARERGYGAALLADPMSLTGAVEFCDTAEKVGIIPLIGSTFELPEGGELVLVARTPIGYRSLSRLITECHLGEPRLYPLCRWDRLERHSQDLLCLTGGDDGPLNRLLIRRDYDRASALVERLIGLYGRENVFIQVERSYLPWQISVNRRLLELAERYRLVPVAGGPVQYEQPNHFPAQDVLVCVETLCLIDEVDGRKPPRDPEQPQIVHPPRRGLNAERYMRPIEEFEALFCDRPDLIDNAWRVVERCEPKVLPGRTVLPRFCEDEDNTLRKLVLAGAQTRFPKIGSRLSRRIGMELERINRLGYARHFLVAWDMCNWADQHGILYSGRGSVVDSLVAYCLGMSRIDPWHFKLHFDRFLPNDAKKRPDIDIDFEARRRDDVRNYLVSKYGEAHVATVGAVGTYRSRGIIREVGKVMGIPEETLSFLAKRLHGGVSPHRLEQALVDRPELRDSDIPKEKFRWVFQFAEQLMDLPRNLRSHSSGVIISSEPICDTVPVTWSGVEGVKIIQWDKRSAKRCFDKFDVLCLRGNDALGDTQRNVQAHDPSFSVTKLPLDDPETFRAMQSGNLIGIPQSASPAMRQAHIRIKTENLKDAGIVQAGIRPGVGGAVKLNEFIARRRGKPFRLLHQDMAEILDHTLGIVVFQEQIDQLLQKFGDYTSDEAELIREGIYKYRREGYAAKIREEVIAKIERRGYGRHVAAEVYELVAGFQGYGFAEGHALAFAEISIRSIYCQQNYPAEYFGAILDAQPAGYYGPATLANEARNRGVKILPPDINLSGLTFKVEDVKSDQDPKIVMPNSGIRTSLRQIGGISEELRVRLLEERGEGAFLSFFDFVARAQPARDELEKLILCGAFDSLFSNRRAFLWAIPKAMEHSALVNSMRDALPLFIEDPEIQEGIADFSLEEKAIYERSILGMDIERHMVAFERERVRAKGGITALEAGSLTAGSKGFVVGNPIRLRFPPTSSGKRVVFFDLEDETGLLNVTCFDDVYQRDGHKLICNPYITLWGEAQDRDGHIAFLAHRIYAYQPLIKRHQREFEPLPLVTADFLVG